MINFRIIARAFSLLLIVEGLFMLVSAGVSFLYHEHAAIIFLLIQRLLQLSQGSWFSHLYGMKKEFTAIRKDTLLLQGSG